VVHTRESRLSASEIKFVLDPGLGHQVRNWARSALESDPHGEGPFADEYRTTSLYFDTAKHDVFHRRGSFGRAKYRIRRYSEHDFVFLERKLRKPGFLFKRRTRTPIGVLHQLERTEADGPWLGDWFHRRLLARRLRPVCRLSYHRMARGLSVNGTTVRLTLDDSVAVAAINAVHFDESPALPILPQQLILELKFHGQLPTMFKRLIEELRLTSRTASKYRFGMTALGHVLTGEASSPLAGESPHG
jgi:hypothetical protein